MLSMTHRLGLILIVLGVFANVARAQSAPVQPGPEGSLAPGASGDSSQPAPPPPEFAVHGVVTNALSGEPLPRALVQVDGETGPGVLTDGDGKFDVKVPGLGTHNFQLTKPGFHDLLPNLAGGATVLENSNGITHSVVVTDGMTGLSFSMTPTSVIRGHIDLSTSEPAQGVGVILYRRRLQGGHATWMPTSNARTNSDGDYRFAGLDEGDYVIATDPARDNETFGAPVPTGATLWNGYAAAFYPDARDFAGASKIHLRSGDNLQANFTLRLEPFHLVRATVVPAKGAEKIPMGYAPEVLDAQGHSLPYPAVRDGESGAVQAMLPDGVYDLHVTATPHPQTFLRRVDPATATLHGSVLFTVSGHPITNLRMALSERATNTLVVSLTRNSTRPAPPIQDPGVIFVAVTQAGESQTGGVWEPLAQGAVPADLETNPLPPGTYWVHTNINQNGLCESSFTAGGASLAREPLVVGPGGAMAPLSLTLRDDCSDLKLNLPPDLMTATSGEEAAYTVYVVPDFDSTVDVAARTLRVSAGGTLDLDSLTPGRYHVYAFASPVELEYRNPDALAHLSNGGQAVTLDPSSTSSLTLEIPR